MVGTSESQPLHCLRWPKCRLRLKGRRPVTRSSLSGAGGTVEHVHRIAWAIVVDAGCRMRRHQHLSEPETAERIVKLAQSTKPQQGRKWT